MTDAELQDLDGEYEELFDTGEVHGHVYRTVRLLVAEVRALQWQVANWERKEIERASCFLPVWRNEADPD